MNSIAFRANRGPKRCQIQDLKCILDPSPIRIRQGPADSKYIKSACRVVPVLVPLQKGFSGEPQPGLFSGVNGFFRSAEGKASAVSHFYKHQRSIFLQYQIDLSPARPIVPCHEA